MIKLLAVTMGETAADYLAVNLGLGLIATAVLMSVVLVIALAVQFARKKYVPAIYWSAVVLISIVGTLLTDCLVDIAGVSLTTTTICCGIALMLTFFAWFTSERTLSIHTIFTARRESFYWLAILLTFAFGTGAGDLVAEHFELGYLVTGVLFAGIVAAFAFGHFVLKLNAILMFWLAYIFTRPLGASLGDLMSQPTDYGGLGFGTILTSVGFLACIIAVVGYMTYVHDGDEPSVSVSAS
jgi:uncharacterized membrane-anchored protein